MELEPVQTGILGVNTWIVPLAGQAVFIVDPACSSLTGDENSVIDYVEQKGLVPVGIFLTHGHFDHVMGLKTLKEKWPSLPVAIHSEDVECIGKNSAFVQNKFLAAVGADEFEIVSCLSGLPDADIILHDGASLDKYILPETIISAFAGAACAPDIEAVMNALSHWKVLHTPGHSKGSVCFYNDVENVLISGDTVFYCSYGRTDLYGGDEIAIKKSLCHIMETLPKKTAVYPGHGSYGFTLESNFY
ncbi:MBL fold metallo-hydrolase [Treponema sp.]|uniref:MBL fold metallo-hydrolase n=1 Tax=Treponema sp. TaxID=166 RepID=UPI00298D8B07|nr:MBL fold metallo-hydrolase [Treponema sp.]MCR5613249.1 MBL fold metallo-hydrolase [Treponema sp.]